MRQPAKGTALGSGADRGDIEMYTQHRMRLKKMNNEPQNYKLVPERPINFFYPLIRAFTIPGLRWQPGQPGLRVCRRFLQG